VTRSANIPDSGWGMGCATGDLDNDGAPDLLILNKGPNTLLKNNGDGTFTDVSKDSGMDKDASWSLSASMADYDHDGLMDIYVVNFIDFVKDTRVFERSSGFVNPVSSSIDPVLYNSQSNNLYKNGGGFHFTDKARALGVDDASGRGQAIRWLDVNKDTYADLVVINNTGSSNQLYINRGGHGFERDQSLYRIESTVGSHSAVSGDVDNDGDVDLIVSQPGGNAPMLLMNGGTPVPAQSTQALSHRGFEDLAWQLSFADNNLLYRDGWGAALDDFNNDGWLDVYMANGLTEIDPDSGHVTVGQKDTLWVNRSGFLKPEGQHDPYQLPSRGVAQGDFNNDGKQDLIVTQNNGYVRLLINVTENAGNWVGVKLSKSGADMDGAVLTLNTDHLHQLRQVYSNNTFLSQSSSRLHFGIGSDDHITSLKIALPSGKTYSVGDAKINRYNVIEKDGAMEKTLDSSASGSRPRFKGYEGLNVPERLLLVQVLSNAQGDPRIIPGLVRASLDDNASVRLAALEGLYDSGDKVASLETLYRFLSDADESVRLRTLDYLEKLELERSVYWLLALFSDPSPAIRCRVANIFEKYFREEEAVVNRKYLGIRGLIFLLSDDIPEVRVCSARALAESRSFRAVSPLIALLSDDNETVRINAARSLGYLRDKSTVAPLVSLAEDKEQPPGVRASTLIALFRLGYGGLDRVFRKVLLMPENLADREAGHHVIQKILASEDEVIGDRMLAQYRGAISDEYCPSEGGDSECISREAIANRNASARDFSQPGTEEEEFNKEIGKLGVMADTELIHMVDDEGTCEDQRMRALRYLAKKRHPYAKDWIVKRLRSKGSTKKPSWVGLLANFFDYPGVERFVWDLLSDKTNGYDVRLEAANVPLMAKAPPEKLLDIALDR